MPVRAHRVVDRKATVLPGETELRYGKYAVPSSTSLMLRQFAIPISLALLWASSGVWMAAAQGDPSLAQLRQPGWSESPYLVRGEIHQVIGLTDKMGIGSRTAGGLTYGQKTTGSGTTTRICGAGSLA